MKIRTPIQNLNLKTTFKANNWDLLSNINTNHFNVMQSKAPLKYLTIVRSIVIIYYCFFSSPMSNYFIFNTLNDKRGQIIHSEMLTKSVMADRNRTNKWGSSSLTPRMKWLRLLRGFVLRSNGYTINKLLQSSGEQTSNNHKHTIQYHVWNHRVNG